MLTAVPPAVQRRSVTRTGWFERRTSRW
jgi:hypothetical protein